MIEEAPDQTGIGPAVLDEAVLDALGQLQGHYDAKFVNRIITMFMETALVLLTRLKAGVANGEILELHHASHELKSCSATIGAYSLAARCERLELMAGKGVAPDPALSVEAIGIEYRRAESCLIARLARQQLAETSTGPVLADR